MKMEVPLRSGWRPSVLIAWLCCLLFGIGMAFQGEQLISLSFKQGWAALVFVLTFIALIAEWYPPHLTMFVSAAFLTLTNILSPQEFLHGFSNETLMTIAMLCIVVKAIELNGLLRYFSRFVMPQSKNKIAQQLGLYLPIAALSAFLNNTPLVLLFIPIIRKWALDHGLSPSKFLIPLSYVVILGGMCTLIGTSSNLVVDGFLREHGEQFHFTFFELGLVGLPCTIVGILYLIAFSPWIPDRKDTLSCFSQQAREFIVDFLVGPLSPLAHQTIEQGKSFFRHEQLIAIERHNGLFSFPSLDTVILPGDRLTFAGDANAIVELYDIPDLRFVADPHFELNVESSHLSEVVLSFESFLIGKTVREVHFRSLYGASVIAIYRQGAKVSSDVQDTVLKAGDTLILISSRPWNAQAVGGSDFYFVQLNQKLTPFKPKKALFVFCLTVLMILFAAIGGSMMLASLAAALILVFTKSLSLKEAQSSITWDILILIGSCFAFGTSLEASGLAKEIAYVVMPFLNPNPYLIVGGLLLITMIGTEFLPNNAVPVIFFPIGLQLIRLLGYEGEGSIKTLGVILALGSSYGFAIPTGYQTHMFVYGPGGYRFTDFIKVGLPLDLLIWGTCTALVPLFWPLS